MSSNYQIKISKQGKDIHLADYNELVFTSEFPLLKVYKTGYHQIILTKEYYKYPDKYYYYNGVSIEHRLGKKPAFIAFTQHFTNEVDSTVVVQDNQKVFKQFSWSDAIDFNETDPYWTEINQYHAYTDETYLHMNWRIIEPLNQQERIDFFYFIFGDPVNQDEYNTVDVNFAGNSIVGQSIVAKPFNS